MFKVSLSNMIGKGRRTVPADEIMSSRGTMPMASDACVQCGTCAGNCPSNAIMIDDGWKVDLGKCIFCMDCAMVCPQDAISEKDAPDYALSREDLVFGLGTIPGPWRSLWTPRRGRCSKGP